MDHLSPDAILHPISGNRPLPPVNDISDELLRSTVLSWLRKNDLNGLQPGIGRTGSELPIRLVTGRFVIVNFAPGFKPVEEQWPFKVIGFAGSHYSEGIPTGGREARLCAVVQEWVEATKTEPKLRQALEDTNTNLGKGFNGVVEQVAQEVERFVSTIGNRPEMWQENHIVLLLRSVAGYDDDPEIFPEMLHDFIESNLAEQGIPHSPSVVKFVLVNALKRKGYEVAFTPEPRRGILVTTFCLDNEVISQVEVGVSFSEEHNFNQFPFIARKHRNWWRRSKYFNSPPSLGGEGLDTKWTEALTTWQKDRTANPDHADNALYAVIKQKLPNRNNSQRRIQLHKLMELRGFNDDTIKQAKNAIPRSRRAKKNL